MTIKDKIMKENPKLWGDFEQCTKDIAEASLDDYCDESMNSYMVKHLNVEGIEPYMIFIIFCRLKETNYTYKDRDNTLFDIPFRFQNYYCVFSFEKTGLILSINTQDEEIMGMLFKKLKSAIKITNLLLNPIIKEEINKGNFTLENHSGLLRQRYLYFREKADTLSAISEDHMRDIKIKREVIFNTQSMLDAYFSFHEHILILLLPFKDFNKNIEKVTDLISANWTSKYKRIFNPQVNPEYMHWFDKLKSLKELRNKYSHGGFEKKNGSLFPNIEGVGTIPVQPPETNGGLYNLQLINDIYFEEICHVIDEYESFLFESSWRLSLAIIESGLDIRYDDDFIIRLNSAISSEGCLQSFLNYEFELIDYEANMDW